jgi:hypothetical protein
MERRRRQRDTGPSERTAMAYEMRHLDVIAAEFRRHVQPQREGGSRPGAPRTTVRPPTPFPRASEVPA